MSRPGITYNDVATAAQQLCDNAINPTIEQVRQLLGTGSSTTITQHLRRWKASQTDNSLQPVKEGLPIELIAALKGVWEQVIHHAEARTQQLEAAHHLALTEAQQELQKYKANNQRWQQLFNQWTQEKGDLVRDKLTLQQATDVLQKNHAELTAALASQHQQLTDKQERIEELNRLHQLTQANLEHYRESTRLQRLADEERQAQQVALLTSSLATSQQQLADTKQQNMTVQHQLDTLAHDHALLSKDRELINEQLALLQANYHHLDTAHQETKANAQYWQHQHAVLQTKFDEEHAAHIQQQTHHAVLCQQLTAAQALIKELKDQCNGLAREKWEISQEKSQLEGQLIQMQQIVAA